MPVSELCDIPLFMTPAQLAALTGEHEGGIRRGIREGRIPATKVNGRWMICRDEVFNLTLKKENCEKTT